MDNNFTVDAALVTAFAAIVAPTITALIHSIKEYRISKMTHTVETKLNLFEAFSNAYMKCQYGPEKTGYMDTFYHASMKLVPLARKRATRRSLFNLANQVKHNGASAETDKLYEKCLRLLAKEF